MVACAGITVQPGDLVIGDDDGVVVLQPGLAPETSPPPSSRNGRRSSSLPRWQRAQSPTVGTARRTLAGSLRELGQGA